MREYFIDGIPYISKEQFCKLAHVRKANALKLIQSGLIPYIDIGDQTHRYLIRQSDAEAYLTDRAHDPAKYSFQRESRIQTYPGKFDRNFANELSQYASVLWKDEPQMLTVQQVHDLLGYSEHVIRRWYVYGKIVGVSTVLAGLMSAVAVIGAKLSNNQHKVDQAWDWLKRIWIAWAIINGIGAFIAYVAPLFNGLATLTP